MSNELKLGTIPKGDEGRDAVHIAIVPVQAGMLLERGTRVRLDDQGLAVVSHREEDTIGVIDPFLNYENDMINKGSWSWLCLYPKTITSLQHVWQHPAFPDVKDKESHKSLSDRILVDSEGWLKRYVGEHCTWYGWSVEDSYEEFLREVKEDHVILYSGEDCHSLGEVKDAEELFHHLSNVLGFKVDASYFRYFTCSC